MAFFDTKCTSVDLVMSAFNKTISDLDDVANHQSEKAAQHDLEILEQTANRDAALIEQQRAANISKKLKQIVAA